MVDLVADNLPTEDVWLLVCRLAGRLAGLMANPKPAIERKGSQNEAKKSGQKSISVGAIVFLNSMFAHEGVLHVPLIACSGRVSGRFGEVST